MTALSWQRLALAATLTCFVAACGDDPKDPLANNPGADTALDAGDGGTVDPDGSLPTDAGDASDTATDAQPNPDAADAQDATPDADGGTDATDADGGSDAGGPDNTVPVVECRTLTPVDGARCDVQRDGNALLIQGTVLGTDGTYVGGEVLLSDSGFIECVGCDCAAEAAALSASIVTCPGMAISPGLINAHDHITFTQNAPGSWGDERYDHRHEWRTGRNGGTEINVPGNASRQQVQWGELRQVFAGTTSVAGSGSAEGLLRNLDREESELGVGDIDYATFPLGDTSGVQRTTDCSYPNIDSPTAAAHVGCYLAHVAEGVDLAARNEFLCVSSADRGGADLTNENSAFIHLVGLNAVDGAELAQQGTALVWSPRSNISLYGNTAPVTMFHRQGVRIALGTDWTASGSVHILRELACADELNQNHYGNAFTDRELWLMATGWAADALRIDSVLGRLAEGRFGDVTIFAVEDGEDPYRAVVTADVQDIVLVLQSGLPLLGDADVMADIPMGQALCETVDRCGADATVCVERETGASFATLSAANSSAYGLFFCDTPPNEPTCVPFRPGEYDGTVTDADLDGDGIANEADNCPTVFNPVRPVDDGVQGDFDADGVGDVCDVCPLDADTDACTSFDADDRDGDGIANTDDNCPLVANEGQADTDLDGIGDDCDPCPEFSDASGACQSTIQDIKQGVTPLDARVVVEGVVTGVDTRSYWLQDVDADSPEYSGIYLFNGAQPTVEVGQRVRVAASTSEFFGQLQLSGVTSLEVLDEGPIALVPAVVAPEDVGDGGALAEAYEGVLVTVEGEVTAVNPPAGGGDSDPTQEYVIGDGIKVNDLIYLTTPFPDVGDALRVTGPIRFANGSYKVEPRSAEDVVVTGTRPPALVAFTPERAFTTPAASGAAVTPSTLTLTLDRPAPEGGAFITLFSTNAAVVEVPAGVTIPEGDTSIEVTLGATVAADDPVEIIAEYSPVSLSAFVTVIAPGREAELGDVTPNPVVLSTNGSAEVTVQLDIPLQAATATLGVTPADALVSSADVTLEAGALAATVTITAGDTAGETTVTLTLGGSEVQVDVEVTETPLVGLVLSEVYYDHPSGDDGFEWIELYNGSAASVDLSAYTIGAGGRTYTNATYALSGTVEAFGCVVIGGPSSAPENGAPVFDVALNFEPDIQNSGDTADAVGLFLGEVTDGAVPVDAVIYGGTNGDNFVDATGAVGAVSVGDAPATNSIEQTASGWAVQAAPTPNVCRLGE
jgi:large repetitive protein